MDLAAARAEVTHMLDWAKMLGAVDDDAAADAVDHALRTTAREAESDEDAEVINLKRLALSDITGNPRHRGL